jgi:hypothetical protein
MSMKFIIAAVVMFIMTWALSFVVHGFLLSADYAASAAMRPPADAQPLMGYMILAMALFAIAFAWIYERGREDRPWLAQGLRYGLAVAFLTVIPTYLIYHVVTPVPLALAIKQIVYDTIRLLLMGVVVAWIYR